MRNDWLNRNTKQLVINTSPGDMAAAYPSETFVDPDGIPASNENWIYDPELGAVEGWPARYWIITGDTITLMDDAARSLIDAALLEAARDMVASQLDDAEDILHAFMLLVLDELNAHAGKINAILDAIDAGATLADVQTQIRTISDYPTRTAQQLRDGIRNKLGS